MTGVFAAAIALPSVSSLYPQPSKMIRTSGETDPVCIKDSSLLSTGSLVTWQSYHQSKFTDYFNNTWQLARSQCIAENF